MGITLEENDKIVIQAALAQLADMLDQSASYAEGRSGGMKNSPGKELYWGGYIDGMRDAATFTRETLNRFA